jgi:hypothetical protein
MPSNPALSEIGMTSPLGPAAKDLGTERIR